MFSSCEHKLELVNAHGGTEYQIVSGNHPEDRYAAEEFQKYVEQATGISIPIINFVEEVPVKAIIIGDVPAVGASDEIFQQQLKGGGFYICTDNQRLIIKGMPMHGTLNGVYSFLEEIVGVRYYARDAVVVPPLDEIVLYRLNILQNPSFRHRELHMPEPLRDESYARWHKLTTHAERNRDWGMWVHTYQKLMPATRYFRSYPEYFAKVGCCREGDGQLCLSNAHVVSLLGDALDSCIQQNRKAEYWSVSQNDNYKYCGCDSCKSLYKQWGGPSGAVLNVANTLARRFPQKQISTLAYQFSRNAPKNIQPENNVNIMLCSIECDRALPISSEGEGGFATDLADWGKLTPNILVWDYTVQYRNLVSPFPNLRVLGPNVRLFKKHHVEMLFEQGCGNNFGEFHALRSYILAKLMWNSCADTDSLMVDFTNGYYGAAGPFILEYIHTMHDALDASDNPRLGIYGFPTDAVDSYLTPDLLNQYQEVFHEAMEAVENDSVLYSRVQAARLPLDFAILEIALLEPDRQYRYFDETDDDRIIRPDMVKRLADFREACIRHGVLRLHEHGLSPQQYYENRMALLKRSVGKHKAMGCDVILMHEASKKYANQPGVLVDGKRGVDDYHFNWMGFEGDDMIATITLTSPQPVDSVMMDFLYEPKSWIFSPLKMVVMLCDEQGEVMAQNSVSTHIDEHTAGPARESFQCHFPHIKAAQVKVMAENRKQCPQWHPGSGLNSWIFCDEIRVK